MTGVYAQLLATSLGNDGVTAFVANATRNETDGLESPDLPTSWQLTSLPQEPEPFLRELRAAAEVGLAKSFLASPWLSWKDLPSDLRVRSDGMQFHELALLSLVETAKPGALVGCLMPSATLTSERNRPFRERLMHLGHVAAVIEGCETTLSMGLHPHLPLTTVVIEVGSEGALTRFFRIPHTADRAGLMDEFRRLLRREGGSSANAYVMRRRLAAGSSFSYDLRSPDMDQMKRTLANFGQTRPLGELFEVHAGVHASISQTHEDDTLVPLIQGRDIGLNRIDFERVSKRVPPSPDKLIRPGDLLVRAVVGRNSERLTVVEAPLGMEDAVAGESVLVLRPNKELDADVRKFVRAFLSSPVAMSVIKALMPHMVHVNIAGLIRVRVPLPDEDMLAALRRLDDARSQLSSWEQETESVTDSLFESEGLTESRTRLLSIGQRMGERIRAARQIGDLGFRVRTLFPHPVAYRWREIEATDASRDAYLGYKRVLEASEVLVCYLAIMAIACARQLDEPIAYLGTVAERFAEGPARGLNFGDWLSVLLEVRDGRRFRDRVEDAAFPELLDLWRSEDASAAKSQLKRWRDDESHLRGLAEGEWRSAFEDAKGYLQLLLQEASFLAKYPPRFIEGSRWRESTQSIHYDFRDLRGDHPFVPVESATSTTHRIEEGALYLVGKDSNLYRITPLAMREFCPVCGRASTFVLDSYKSSNGVSVFRALEHPHTREFPGLADELRHVGVIQ